MKIDGAITNKVFRNLLYAYEVPEIDPDYPDDNYVKYGKNFYPLGLFERIDSGGFWQGAYSWCNTCAIVIHLSPDGERCIVGKQ